jgi:hypothetical protein
MTELQTKTCKTCKEEKPIDEFQTYLKAGKKAYYNKCKDCIYGDSKERKPIITDKIIYMPNGLELVNNIIAKEICHSLKY